MKSVKTLSKPPGSLFRAGETQSRNTRNNVKEPRKSIHLFRKYSIPILWHSVRHQVFRDERHYTFPHQAHSPVRGRVGKSLQFSEVAICKLWVQESPELGLLTQGSKKVPQRGQHESRLCRDPGQLVPQRRRTGCAPGGGSTTHNSPKWSYKSFTLVTLAQRCPQVPSFLCNGNKCHSPPTLQ